MCFPDSAGNAWHIFDHEWLMDLPTPGIVDKAIKDRTAQLENEGWNEGYNNGYKAGALEGSGGLQDAKAKKSHLNRYFGGNHPNQPTGFINPRLTFKKDVKCKPK